MKNELCSLHNQGLRMHENFWISEERSAKRSCVYFFVTQLLSDNIYRCQRSLFTLGLQNLPLRTTPEGLDRALDLSHVALKF